MEQESIEDEERIKRPIEAVTPQKVAIIDEMVLDDCSLKVKDLALISDISKRCFRRILYDQLGMNKISARWEPRLLSAARRRRHVECASLFEILIWRQLKGDFGIHCHWGSVLWSSIYKGLDEMAATR